jgi:hypothetical protein
MWKNIEKDTTEIVYDNKNLHITELEDTLPVLHRRYGQWNHSGCSFTEMFAFIKRNKTDAKIFA